MRAGLRRERTRTERCQSCLPEEVSLHDTRLFRDTYLTSRQTTATRRSADRRWPLLWAQYRLTLYEWHPNHVLHIQLSPPPFNLTTPPPPSPPPLPPPPPPPPPLFEFHQLIAMTATAAVLPRSFRSPFHRPPSKFLQLLELRAFREFGASLALLPLLRTAPRGDGHPVLVLPGLIASDTSTEPLRAYLADRGYDVHGWGLGRNLGLRPGVETKMKARLREIHRESGRKVSIVGWSLGGVFAREIASAAPEAVRTVITLGSPIHGDPRSTNAWRVYELASGQSVDDPKLRRPRDSAPPVPTTSIYSRSDGIVAWQCSVEPQTDYSESIEVIGSHCGLGVNASVLYAIADRLAQPEGEWKHFNRSGLRGWVSPAPSRQDLGWSARGRSSVV